MSQPTVILCKFAECGVRFENKTVVSSLTSIEDDYQLFFEILTHFSPSLALRPHHPQPTP